MEFDPIIVGCDLGQRVDPTAIIVVECGRQDTDRMVKRSDYDVLRKRRVHVEEPDYETTYTARHIDRVPLGTGYISVAEHLVKLAEQLVERRTQEILDEELREGSRFLEPKRYRRWAESGVWFLLDVTGVGRPVVDDIFRPRMSHLSCSITAVTFRAGETSTVTPGVREGSMGKAFMVSRLQALLQSQRIRLPDTPEARALTAELLSYEIKVNTNANLELGAPTGKHDDLATALGLACLLDPKDYQTRVIDNPWHRES